MRRWIRSLFGRPSRRPVRNVRPAVVRLEDRAVPATNLLVSLNQGSAQLLQEFTPAGGLVRTVAIPGNGAENPTEARDLVASPDGKIFVYNGSSAPRLATYQGGNWTQQSYSGWTTSNITGYGGIGRYQNYVYVTDMWTGGGESSSNRGIVRFNVTNGTATRFANSNNFSDVSVGADGLVYALQASSNKVHVFNATTMSSVRTVTLPNSVGGQTVFHRGVTANSAGHLFVAGWEGRVHKFTATGSLLGSVSLPGPGSGPMFYNPMDIDVAGDGRVAVGTYSGHVVQMNESLANVTYFHVGPGADNVFVSFAQADFNTPPRFSEMPPRLGVAINTSSHTLPFTVTDDESGGSELVVTASSSNPAVLADSGISLGGFGNNRTVTVTPLPGQTGSATVTLTATDPMGGTATKTFVVDVSNPPTLSDLGDIFVPESSTSGAIPFTVGDVETPAGSLLLGVSWSNSTLLPVGSIVFGGSGADRTVKFTPAPGKVGTATVTVSVYDEADVYTSDTFVVTVANTPPVVSDVGNVTVTYGGSSGELPFTVGDIQDAAGALTVTASSSNTDLLPLSGIVLGGAGADRTVTVTPAAGQFGSSVVTLTVTDGGGLTVTDTFLVTVGNNPPSISDVADVAVPFNGSSGALAFTVGDGETPAELTVTAASSNTALVPLSGIVISGSGADRTVTVNPAAGQGGTATVTLTVTDPQGATATDTFVVTVNAPPSISDVGDVTVPTGGSSGALAFTVGDGETAAGDLVVTASSSNVTLLPLSGIVLGGSGADRTVTVTPAAGQWGTATVTLTVTDAGGLTSTDTFVVTVPNTPPSISDVGDVSIAYNGSTGPLAFTVGDAQTPADNLGVSVASSNTALLPLSGIFVGGSGANRTVTLFPAFNQVGTATVTLTVIDDGGQTATDTFVLTVTNAAPTVSDVADRVIHVGGTTGAIPFTVGDPEAPAGDLVVTASSSNGVMFPADGIVLGGSGADRTITLTPHSYYFGSSVITLTVTDALGQTATDTFEVRVNTPVITIADVTQAEGTGGTTAYVFTLTMDPPSEIPVTVNYGTQDLTATAGSDYTAASGTVTFAPGETTATVTVLVNGDSAEEANETFRLNLSGASGAIVGDSYAVGTITNDDIAPRLSIDDVTAFEGHNGHTAFTFTVSLAGPAAGTVTVNYATQSQSALGYFDFVNASGTLTFAPGEVSKTVTVQVIAEQVEEADETFRVNLSGAVGAPIQDGQGIGTIRNDDVRREYTPGAWGQYTEYFNAAPTLSASTTYLEAFAATDPPVLAGGPAPRESRGLMEFNLGAVAPGDFGWAVLEFTETYVYEQSQPVEIWGYAGDGALSLADGTAAGVLLGTFDPRAGTGARWVTLDRDALAGLLAGGSQIGLRLVTTPDSQARFQAPGYGAPPRLVLRAEPAPVPTVSISDSTREEADVEGSQVINQTGLFFTVTLSQPTSVPVTVYYAPSDGTALAGDDYDPTAWQVTITAGQTQTSIYVPITADNLPEPTETMTMRLTAATYATLGDAEATGTILDNDFAPIANAGPDVTVPAGSWVSFDGSASQYNPWGNVTVSWDFGSGPYPYGIIPPDRQYLYSGTYTVTLIIEDADRGTSTDTMLVNVTGGNMSVQVGGPTATVAGQQRSYSFTVYGTNGQPYNGTYSLAVNWGDGEPVTNYTNNMLNRPTVSLTHTFPNFGNFPVSVQVSASGQSGNGNGVVSSLPTLMEDGILYVGGDRSNEWMTLTPASAAGGVKVTRNSVNQGSFSPSRVVVFGGEGMDDIRVQTAVYDGQTYAVTTPTLIFGGFHDDRLDAAGAAGPVALIGSGGRDTLYGGSGDDILIGGTVNDYLYGGNGSDILIGGSTNFDLDPNVIALLLAEWSRTDVSLQVRYDHLRGVQSGGLNGSNWLWSGTVQNDSAVDNLSGQGGIDWFFTHPGKPGLDQRLDFTAGEFESFL